MLWEFEILISLLQPSNSYICPHPISPPPYSYIQLTLLITGLWTSSYINIPNRRFVTNRNLTLLEKAIS